MKTVKYASTRWANDRHFCPGRFEWQDGFGVFSYAKSQIPNVCEYIASQKDHHRQGAFLDEYRYLPEQFDVPYEDRFILKEPE